MMEKLYYLQDSRNYVGNCILFWKKGGGYTTDLEEAELFSALGAFAQNNSRDTDIVWDAKYMESKATKTVDSQSIRRAERASNTI
jgi:hypothetical protein